MLATVTDWLGEVGCVGYALFASVVVIWTDTVSTYLEGLFPSLNVLSDGDVATAAVSSAQK